MMQVAHLVHNLGAIDVAVEKDAGRPCCNAIESGRPSNQPYEEYLYMNDSAL